jgi:hypothetical protein
MCTRVCVCVCEYVSRECVYMSCVLLAQCEVGLDGLAWYYRYYFNRHFMFFVSMLTPVFEGCGNTCVYVRVCVCVSERIRNIVCGLVRSFAFVNVLARYFITCDVKCIYERVIVHWK